MARIAQAVAIALLGCAVLVAAAGRAGAATVGSTELKAGWALRSATNVTDTGETISQVGYATTGWYPISLPSTVLAGLVANNDYHKIYVGMILHSVPELYSQMWWI